MPIIKNASNEIEYTAPSNQDRLNKTGVSDDEDFAVCDANNVLKQVKFEVNPTNNDPATVTIKVDVAADQTIDLSSLAGGGNSFGIVQTPVGTSPTADQATDTLILTTSDNTLVVTGNSTTDTIDLTVGANLANANIAAGAAIARSKLATGTASRVVVNDGSGALSDSAVTSTALANLPTASIIGTINGGGSTITTGIKADVHFDFPCTITRVTLLSDETGSIVVDLWKDSYTNFPPTVADSITASAKPTISAGIKSQDSTLTGWTTSIAAGDVLRINVDSCSAITRCMVGIRVTRT